MNQPVNVRNWWIKGEVDGKATEIATGPKGRDGGFNLTIYQRDCGQVKRVIQLNANVCEEDDGEEYLTLWVHNLTHTNEVLHVETRR